MPKDSELEIYLSQGRERSVIWSEGHCEDMGQAEGGGIGIRVILRGGGNGTKPGRQGYAYTTHLSQGSVEKSAQMALDAGCNDFMGTLINESISTSAGAIYGQRMAPREMRALIREMGRIPAERNTLYDIVREFDREPDDHHDPLDLADGTDERFGSYVRLTQAPEFRFGDTYRRAEPVA